MLTKEDILKILKDVYDPEIPVNIVDLGLIYGIEIENSKVSIKMTLTAPGCPLAENIRDTVEKTLLSIEGIEEANVEVVWDPPWNVTRLTEEGKKVLRSYGFNV